MMLPTDRLPITVKCALPDGMLRVNSMTGDEELGRLFEYEVELYTEVGEIAISALLGKPMTVCLSKQEGVRFFNGIVTRVVRAGQVHRFYVWRVTLSPKLWLLTRTRDCRIYQNRTVPEVVGSMLSEHGIEFSARLQTDNYRSWDYLTQYRETDFAFMSRILEQEGIYYYFRHSMDKHELVLSDSLASHEPVAGYERVPVRPPGLARVERDHFTDWRSVHRATTAKVTLQDHDFRLRRGTDIAVIKGVDAAHDQDEMEIYDYPGVHVVGPNAADADAGATRQAGEHYALTALEEQRAALERIEALGNARGVEVGALIRIDSLDQASRQFLVVSTRHQLQNVDFQSGALAAGHELCHLSLDGIDGSRHFRPTRSAEKPIIAGPQTAIVVGEPGEEIWTDKFGRVKVQFHWDREGQSDQNSSCWLRVGQVWAGSNFGGMHIPRVGHEVIVQFLEGDPDRPLITGSVYNADNMPPYPLPAGATQSGIRSRSSKGGSADNFNEIRFEDKKGAEGLHLQAEKDMNTLVKNDQSTTVQNNQSVTVQANRTVSVTGNQTHSVTGNRSVSVTGNDSQTFQAQRTVSVTGTDTHSITGARTETYQGGRSRSVTGADSTTVNGEKSTSVQGGYEVNAAEHYRVAQGGNQLFIKDQVLLESQGQMQVMNQECQIDMTGGNTVVEAAESLTLQCGSASITLRSDGSVTINAPKNMTAVSGDSGLELVPAGATVSSAKTIIDGKNETCITAKLVKLN